MHICQHSMHLYLFFKTQILVTTFGGSCFGDNFLVTNVTIFVTNIIWKTCLIEPVIMTQPITTPIARKFYKNSVIHATCWR